MIKFIIYIKEKKYVFMVHPNYFLITGSTFKKIKKKNIIHFYLLNKGKIEPKKKGGWERKRKKKK